MFILLKDTFYISYDNKNYVTQSVSLEDRKGVKADLIKYVTMKQLGLPALEVPENNPITREKIELGRKLFFPNFPLAPKVI